MSRTLKTVVVNGSLSKPSRTRALLDAVQDRLSEAVALEVEVIDLVDLIEDIGGTLYRSQLSTKALHALEAIEAAEFLVVGSPVFRGSVPGLFKHLFDLVELNALEGKPVLLAATGGSTRHALVIDHQLRPLFAFFQALTLPIGVYGTPEDIDNGQIVSAALNERIDLTVQLAVPVLQSLLKKNVPVAAAPVVQLEAKAA
ncbi:FMN reductase [Lampropedia puyangensis]|uniref:FMN reductase n=1 Tax=Lampropedia puyangensis TaxID=1330072 RepID=A0A4V4GRQ9_9BURK|nr:FMN reductase [Lampropedia puyangensis]THU02566.1 FMN reductase [Lampropedia puyangensis]